MVVRRKTIDNKRLAFILGHNPSRHRTEIHLAIIGIVRAKLLTMQARRPLVLDEGLDDLLSDVIVHCLERIAKFDATRNSSPLAYFATMAQRKALHYCRQRGMRVMRSLNEEISDGVELLDAME